MEIRRRGETTRRGEGKRGGEFGSYRALQGLCGKLSEQAAEEEEVSGDAELAESIPYIPKRFLMVTLWRENLSSGLNLAGKIRDVSFATERESELSHQDGRFC